MFLFQKRFHEGIVDGTVTLTFRRWTRPLVRPGMRYRVHPIGVVVVDAIEQVPLASMTAEDAQSAGFATLRELCTYISEAPSTRVDDAVFRVAFHYGGEDDRVDGALDTEVSDEESRAIERRLAAMDARAPKPWTRAALGLIERNPRVAASKLAPQMKMEKAVFKANIVKLKKLGLTMSFETGYEISPRGRAFLARGKAPKRKK